MRKYQDYIDKIVFPIKVSYKLDGIYCVIKDKKGYSKNGKLFKCLPELDFEDHSEGELYNHNMSFEEICSAVKRTTPNNLTSRIHFFMHANLERFVINSREELELVFQKSLDLGYEGLVLETNTGILKMKSFLDEEYLITGYIEGKGKLSNMLGSLICGNFSVKMIGTHEYLSQLWEDKDRLIGKQLTVRFQNKSTNGIPRFAKGLRIRDYE